MLEMYYAPLIFAPRQWHATLPFESRVQLGQLLLAASVLLPTVVCATLCPRFALSYLSLLLWLAYSLTVLCAILFAGAYAWAPLQMW